MNLTQSVIVVYASPDGKNWSPVKPEDVPQWLKEPDTMGLMVDGNLVRDERDPDALWYAAVTCPTEVKLPQAPNLLHKPEVLAAVTSSAGIPN